MKNSALVSLDMLERDILFVFGSEKDVRRQLAKYFTKEEIEDLVSQIGFKTKGTTVYVSKFNAHLVWLPDKPKTAQEVGFLVHEIFHATYAVMCNIGVTLSDDSEEIYAYTIGFLTKKILEIFPISLSSCPSQ